MAPQNDGCSKKVMNKGAWTADEDRRLAEYIEIHGAKRWKTIAIKSGLNRCGKSCRLRWLNYLRPNIKRGNISDAEEDLILRLHKLLGNRWSLIAGRLPGRTDNEIKNYWNSHLSKKICSKEKISETSSQLQELTTQKTCDLTQLAREPIEDHEAKSNGNNLDITFDVNEFFNFTSEDSCGLNWINKFLEFDEDDTLLTDESGMAKVLERYQIHVDEEAAICKTVQESEMCDRQVTNPGSNLLEVIPRHLQLQEDIEQLNVAELTHLEKRLDAMLRPVKCRKEQLMKDTVKTLYEKEQQLRQENSAMEQELAKILNETDPIYEHTPLVLAQQEPNSGSPPFVPSTTLPFF